MDLGTWAFKQVLGLHWNMDLMCPQAGYQFALEYGTGVVVDYLACYVDLFL